MNFITTGHTFSIYVIHHHWNVLCQLRLTYKHNYDDL